MATINHINLPVSELHSPLMDGFTGDPASYPPAESGLIVVATDTNLIYRTTGTNAGDVIQIGGGTLEVFTGSASSYTPPISDVLAVKTDVTPNILYRTTGTSPGNVVLVGPLALAPTTGSPVSSVTPDHVGQVYVQQETDRVVQWVSNGLTNTDWIAIGGSAIQALVQPDEAPAFTGQQWHVDTVSTIPPFMTLNELWIGVDPSGPASTASWFQVV